MEAPRECHFPAGTMVTIVGETPLFELGLAEGSPDPPGWPVYMTTKPMPVGQGGPGRWYCVIYNPEEADGVISASGSVPEGWTPPGG